MEIPKDIQTAINSNQEPPDHILPSTKNHIELNKITIQNLKANITQHTKEIQLLMVQCKTALNQLERTEEANFNLNSLFAPYRKLPPEIVAKILHNTIPPLPDSWPTPKLDDWINTYKIFTQINQKWSKIATTDPKIFSELDLDINPTESDKATKLLNLWKTKAQYKVHLIIKISHPLRVKTLMGPLYDLLNNWNNLHTLNLDVVNYQINTHLSTLSNSKLPSLEKLIIKEYNELSLHPIISVNAPLLAPKLQDIQLHTYNLKAIHPENLSKIRKLTLSSNHFKPNTYPEILRECTHLTDCIINMTNELQITQISKEIKEITLLKLEHLTVTTHKELPPLLDIMHTPNLNKLTIIVAIQTLSDKIESILPFINKPNEIEQITILGHAILESQNDFELGLKKKINIYWEETSTRETHRIIHCGDSDTETNSDYYDGASGPEEIIEEEENDDDYLF